MALGQMQSEFASGSMAGLRMQGSSTPEIATARSWSPRFQCRCVAVVQYAHLDAITCSDVFGVQSDVQAHDNTDQMAHRCYCLRT